MFCNKMLYAYIYSNLMIKSIDTDEFTTWVFTLIIQKPTKSNKKPPTKPLTSTDVIPMQHYVF